MKIKSSSFFLSNDAPLTDCGSGIEIMGDDGRSLFSVSLADDGSIEIRANGFMKHNGVMLSECLTIAPRMASTVSISRQPYV
jgi:hypothetical protein